MKKLLIVILALVMSLQFIACFAEGNEDKANEPVGMPNPVVEYDSLEEINKLIGVNLMHPAVMGVTNERFSVINNSVAQYVCEINGLEWTFRAAYAMCWILIWKSTAGPLMSCLWKAASCTISMILMSSCG